MRRFEDREGGRWEIVLGRESWGALYALFVPAGQGRERPVRQTQLDASGYEEAERELDRLDDDQLHMLFDRSNPKES